VINVNVFAVSLTEGNNIGKYVIKEISNGQVTAFDFMQKSMNINSEFLILKSLGELSKKICRR
jgi:hypothetical protein